MSRPLLTAYRHDVHKFTGKSHANAKKRVAGVPVNRTVPHGADRDAAALSRPLGNAEPTVENYNTPYRLSLLTGDPVIDPSSVPQAKHDRAITELVTVDDPEIAHERWLTSDVAAAFNESVYHPYTSLKYHTLLVAALLDHYRNGNDFVDLHLVVDQAGIILPFRTIFAGPRFALRLDVGPTDRPAASLGERPRRSWATVWSELPAHPLDTDHNTRDRVLDANLRRIRAWSTALQYIDDYRAWRPDR